MNTSTTLYYVEMQFLYKKTAVRRRWNIARGLHIVFAEVLFKCTCFEGSVMFKFRFLPACYRNVSCETRDTPSGFTVTCTELLNLITDVRCGTSD